MEYICCDHSFTVRVGDESYIFLALSRIISRHQVKYICVTAVKVDNWNIVSATTQVSINKAQIGLTFNDTSCVVTKAL